MTNLALEVNRDLLVLSLAAVEAQQAGQLGFSGAWGHKVLLVSLSDIIWLERPRTVPETRDRAQRYPEDSHLLHKLRVLLTRKLYKLLCINIAEIITK